MVQMPKVRAGKLGMSSLPDSGGHVEISEARSLVMTLVAKGHWSIEMATDVARKTGYSRREIRRLAYECASDCRATLNPQRISMDLLDAVERLQRIGRKAERAASTAADEQTQMACLNTAANAFSKAGTLSASLIKGAMLANALAPVDEGQRMTEAEIRAELARRGWKPPDSIAGLPAPNVEDPEIVETTGEADDG
jgi:hypothetical protein